MDKQIALICAVAAVLFASLGFIKLKKDYIVLDGYVYEYAGMARLPTSDEIYTPVYKRLNGRYKRN